MPFVTSGSCKTGFVLLGLRRVQRAYSRPWTSVAPMPLCHKAKSRCAASSLTAWARSAQRHVLWSRRRRGALYGGTIGMDAQHLGGAVPPPSWHGALRPHTCVEVTELVVNTAPPQCESQAVAVHPGSGPHRPSRQGPHQQSQQAAGVPRADSARQGWVCPVQAE